MGRVGDDQKCDADALLTHIERLETLQICTPQSEGYWTDVKMKNKACQVKLRVEAA